MLEHHAGAPPQRDEAILVERADIDALHAHAASSAVRGRSRAAEASTPAPLRPMIPKTSPRRTSSVTSRSAAA